MIDFGTTETYDPSLDYSWVDNLKVGNIIITKRLTPKLINTLIQEKVQKRCILHLTCTGYGGTSFLEPGVPFPETTYSQFNKLIELGFPVKQVVLRISPIIPTKEGIDKVIEVLDLFQYSEIKRIRFSTLNMYPHVKKRFQDAGMRLPYTTYSCPLVMRDNLMQTLMKYFNVTTNDIWDEDVCGEIDLNKGLIEKIGCISHKDVEILGLEHSIMLIGDGGKQRSNCLCPDNKKQIIKRKPGKCAQNCLYCYWQD